VYGFEFCCECIYWAVWVCLTLTGRAVQSSAVLCTLEPRGVLSMSEAGYVGICWVQCWTLWGGAMWYALTYIYRRVGIQGGDRGPYMACILAQRSCFGWAISHKKDGVQLLNRVANLNACKSESLLTGRST
jgi:hypothetical protein